MEVLRKPVIRKWRHSSTLNVEAALLSCRYQSCFENYLGFRFASLEHYASSAERVLPTLGEKIDKIAESSKLLANYFAQWTKKDGFIRR